MTHFASFLPRAAFLIGALGATQALDAQTVAGTVTPLRGCTNPGPQDSFIASPLAEQIFVAGDNSLVAFEMESIPIENGWIFRNNLSRVGFSGDGYYEWIAGNRFNEPGVGTLTYRAFITDPGSYIFKIHNRHDDPDPGNANDVWMKINNSPWFKAFSNRGPSSVGVWNWFTDKENGGPVQANLTRGITTIQFSGRSQNFMLDRVHAWKQDTGLQGEDLNLALSAEQRSRANAGGVFEFDIDDPMNEAGLTTGGATVAGLLANLVPAPNSPCGIPLPVFGPTPGSGGELLMDLTVAPFILLPPQAWQGPGMASHFQLPIPGEPGIVGLQISVQGFFFDGTQARAVLADGAELLVGDY